VNPIVAVLLGGLISLIAAIPAVLLLFAAKDGDLKARLRAWAVGMVLRFAIIGGALLFVFQRTDAPRIPVILGVVLVYFLVFTVELVFAFRSSKSQ
jgi:hypothetical protein